MAFNSEFNYRTQVQGETIWEKIKTFQWFLEWRLRAKGLEAINQLRLDAKKEKIKWLRENWPIHEAMELEADVMEIEQSSKNAYELYRINEVEVKTLERLLDEAYEIANPTRLIHSDWVEYSDEEMFEANAINEFTAMIGKEIYAEIIATGRPSPAKIRNAMSSPQTWKTLQDIWLIPKENNLLIVNNNTKEELLYLPTNK